MDIKLKKYRFSIWFKLLAAILCVAGMITMAYGSIKAPYFKYALEDTDLNKHINRDILSDTFRQVSAAAFRYQNEDYIKSGVLLSDEEINERKNNIIQERENSIKEVSEKYNSMLQQRDSANTDYSDSTGEMSAANLSNKLSETLIKERDKEIEDLIKKYNKNLSNIKSNCINEQVNAFRDRLRNLNAMKGIYYTVIVNNEVQLSKEKNDSVASADAFYKTLDCSVKITKDNVYSVFSDSYYCETEIPDNAVVYLALSQDRYKEEIAAFSKNTSEGLSGIKTCLAGVFSFLLGLIYIMYSSGRRVEKDGVHLTFADVAYLDITLLISTGVIFVCISPIYQFARYFWDGKSYMNNNTIYAISSAVIAIGTLTGLLFVSMLAKRVKRHEVIRHTFLYKIYKWIIDIFKKIYFSFNSVFDKSPLSMRLVMSFGAYLLGNFISLIIFMTGSLGVFTGFALMAGVNVSAIYYLLKILKSFSDVKEGAERIRAGEMNYVIPEQSFSELRLLSETINRIGDGLKNAVGSQVKAERMKTELITNVSHDLKTPLTSIITYVDLLKNEGLDSENADKYLKIIDAKSQRLKALTEDLFEAAKATSGSIKAAAEKLDVVSLLSQGLGELSDKIEASGLMFKTSLPTDKLFVMADGKLLWRVIENLISNALKYALPGSRVYIDVGETSTHVTLNIKNISAYELNVEADELMERFKRGDESRHSEGSGLGLSIARSLTELQGGNFHIEIDGDLFKAIIVLPKCY